MADPSASLSARFQSTPPARGATLNAIAGITPGGGFNPRPPRGEVSIHAPRAGGDKATDASLGRTFGFQSTPPARGATVPAWRAGEWLSVFSTGIAAVIQLHRLREVRALTGFSRFEAVMPDIDGEYDTDVELAQLAVLPFALFQSTPPARGATWPL